MSAGSLSILKENVISVLQTQSSWLQRIPKAIAAYTKLYSRKQKYASDDVNSQKEMFFPPVLWCRTYGTRNMFIDKTLIEEMPRAELAEYIRYRYDVYKILHPLAAVFAFGGYSAFIVLPLWLSNYNWMPSNIGWKDKTVMRKWQECQDMLRYKHCPAAITDYRWYYEWHLYVPSENHTAWEELFEKNDYRRNPALVTKIGKLFDEMVPFHRVRRKQIRLLLRAMGMNSFPLFGKLCGQARIRDYWELMLNEDYMVMKHKLLETMTPDEIRDYAWYRYLAPLDKNLSDEQVRERVCDYHLVIGGDDFIETGNIPNLWTLFTFVFGFYNDPAFLDRDAAELDANDYDHLRHWGRDVFLRRLEFENGAFRDEVEVHGLKKLAERKKLME